jgi:hypothetical protein
MPAAVLPSSPTVPKTEDKPEPEEVAPEAGNVEGVEAAPEGLLLIAQHLLCALLISVA